MRGSSELLIPLNAAKVRKKSHSTSIFIQNLHFTRITDEKRFQILHKNAKFCVNKCKIVHVIFPSKTLRFRKNLAVFSSVLHTTKKCATKNVYKKPRFFAQNR